MAYYIGNVFEDVYPKKVEIQLAEFYESVNSEVVPAKALSQGNKFYTISEQNDNGNTETIFIIFNDEQNVYYLFSSVG